MNKKYIYASLLLKINANEIYQEKINNFPDLPHIKIDILKYNLSNASIFILFNFLLKIKKVNKGFNFNIWFFPCFIVLHEILNFIFIFYNPIIFSYGNNIFNMKDLTHLETVKLLLSLLVFLVFIFFNFNKNTNLFQEQNQNTNQKENYKFFLFFFSYIIYLYITLLILKGFRYENFQYKKKQIHNNISYVY